MLLSTLLLLFGTGMWAPGMEAVRSDAFPEYEIAPFEKSWDEEQKKLYFTAHAVDLVDSDSMIDLYSYNQNLRLPMASLTKLMTALIVIEHHDLDEIVTVSQSSSLTEGSTMHLHYGEQLTVKKLLQGLLMNSGNDAAVALAQYHSGTVFAFVNEMNERASQLFMTQTHFVNPHGLDSSMHYSSARDLAVLAKALWKYEVIQEIVNTQAEEVLSEDEEIVHQLKNTNKLLGSIFQVHGMKTGTTLNAGECLLLTVEKEVNGIQKEYFLVILGSQSRYSDARNILYTLLGDDVLLAHSDQ